MFKYIAIILIFTTCTLTGFYQAFQVQRRKNLLIEYRDFLQRIETEMGYFKEPLPLLFEKLHNSSNHPINLLIRYCLLQIEKSAESIAQIWEEGIYEAYNFEPLTASDLRILVKCGEFIGQSDLQGQKGHFSLLKDELSLNIADAETACRVKGPLYSKAGLSVGMVIAIAIL